MSGRKSLLLSIVFLIPPALTTAGGSLSADDIAKIKRVHEQYEEMWLKGDTNGVRNLFTEDSVLLPPHSDTPRIGRKGMDEFWFPPDAPPTQILKLNVIPKDIGGDGQIAYVWGTDEVAWRTVHNGKTTTVSHKGTFLNMLKKLPNGEWKFSHHMWDDPVAPRR
jgi:uncharacterized protein (TIGR02246 family)